MQIVIFRPEERCENSMLDCNVQGITFFVCPVFKIVPYKNHILESVAPTFNAADLLIFSSPSAVHYALPFIQKYTSNFKEKTYFAIGSKTALELKKYGIENIKTPKSYPQESETLLALEELQKIKDKTICIFRGKTGRNVLIEELTKRGAKVSLIPCYETLFIKENLINALKNWKNDPPAAMLITSIPSLEFIRSVIHAADWSWFRQIPCILINKRIQEKALSLGWSSTILSKGLEKDRLIDCIQNIRTQL